LLKLTGVNVNAQDYTGRTVRPPEHCYYIVRLPLS
jgi:hypothetical protein